jgi:branched-chain amino acid aminotransferase
MHNFADLDGQRIEASSARVDAVGAAALIGKGVFTTVAIFAREPFLLDKHLNRLEANARAVGIEIGGLKSKDIEERLNSVIEANRVESGKARITLFDSGPTSVWASGSARGGSSLIISGDRPKKTIGLKLAVSPYRLNSSSPLAGIKSCNYLEQTLALDDAKREGNDEAVRLNERDEIASCSMANIFWFKNDTLYTPSLKTGCLAGTTRSHILENTECEETAASLEELLGADAVYITSAGLGIARVAEIEGRSVPSRRLDIEDLWPER